MRPHLDYGDVIYDQPSNVAFSSKAESVQYNAVLKILGTIRDSSREKLYQEFETEHLHQRRWVRRLRLFYKDLSNKIPKYIYDLIPLIRHSKVSFRNPNLFTAFPCRTEYFKNSFFLCVISGLNKVDPKIHNSTSYLSFRNALIKFHCTKNEVFH